MKVNNDTSAVIVIKGGFGKGKVLIRALRLGREGGREGEREEEREGGREGE